MAKKFSKKVILMASGLPEAINLIKSPREGVSKNQRRHRMLMIKGSFTSRRRKRCHNKIEENFQVAVKTLLNL